MICLFAHGNVIGTFLERRARAWRTAALSEWISNSFGGFISGRNRARVTGYLDVVRKYPDKTAIIRNDRALERYLEKRTSEAKVLNKK
jgi:hypothetical protein